MARLNEAPVSTETIDTLRRKLLRQNRELARVNSTQSLKIRHLENELARTLSENLELRGQIIQLEKEVDDSRTSRIADHALEIKAKLEAQLVEWGTLLSGLGLEPPMKRHSPARRRLANPRPSLSRRTPPQKILRDLAREAETRARDEGRLTPIMEHKSHPRLSMKHPEIVTLCAETGDTSTSPDLGPPPISRFVDGDPIKIDSPSRSAAVVKSEPPSSHSRNPPLLKGAVEKEKVPERKATAARSLEVSKDGIPSLLKDAVEKERVPERKATARSSEVSKDGIPPEKTLPSPVKSGAKRKFGISDDGVSSITVKPPDPAIPKAPSMPTVSRDRSNGKTLKELATIRREAREKITSSSTARKPLASKSTNEDLSSPRKSGKQGSGDSGGHSQSRQPIDKVSKDRPRSTQRSAHSIKGSNATKPRDDTHTLPVITTTEEPACVLAETHLLSPNSPDQFNNTIRARLGDTPPPTDISFSGETSRPSRRARAAVSYAEPNLRDKMRRPTKELVDAVTGEGKFVRRLTSHTPDEAASAEAAEVKRESGTTDTLRNLPAADSSAFPGERPVSPLAGGALLGDELPSSVVTERKKRKSSLATKDLGGDISGSTGGIDQPNISLQESSASSSITRTDSSIDVYEFPSASPSMNDSRSDDSTFDTSGSLSRSTSLRRLSTASHDVEKEILRERPKSAASSRKRASINVPKRSRSDLESFINGFENEPIDHASLGNRASMRRRSTML